MTFFYWKGPRSLPRVPRLSFSWPITKPIPITWVYPIAAFREARDPFQSRVECRLYSVCSKMLEVQLQNDSNCSVEQAELSPPAITLGGNTRQELSPRHQSSDTGKKLCIQLLSEDEVLESPEEMNPATVTHVAGNQSPPRPSASRAARVSPLIPTGLSLTCVIHYLSCCRFSQSFVLPLSWSATSSRPPVEHDRLN